MEKKIEQGFKPRTWLLVILIIVALAIAVFLVYKFIDTYKLEEQKKNAFINKENEKIEKDKFNNRFETYAGTQWGSFVKKEIDNIIDTNKKDSTRKITLIYYDLSTQDENEMLNIKSSFEDFGDYEIIVGYDEDGYVNQVTIKRTIDKNSFNSKFEIDSGTKNGYWVKKLIDDVIASNKKEIEHKITIIHNELTTQDEEELRNLKNKFEDFKNYEVILDYDENNLVYQITIR